MVLQGTLQTHSYIVHSQPSLQRYHIDRKLQQDAIQLCTAPINIAASQEVLVKLLEPLCRVQILEGSHCV